MGNAATMKHSLEHLPESKRDDLRRLATTICEMCSDVEMIVLYGSYARGDYKEEEDLDPDRKSGAASDYDILVVTTEKDTVKNGHLWGTVDKSLQALGLSAWPRVIVHDRWYLAKVLERKHYFFNDVFVEGIALYDSGVFVPKTKEQRGRESLLLFESKKGGARVSYTVLSTSSTQLLQHLAHGAD